MEDINRDINKGFTIHDLPVEERPRERLVQHGERALSVQELLQLILGRGVFSEAIKARAAAVIFAHNHPSGDPEPSEDDLTITKRLVEAGKILGIEVLDHIIVTPSAFFSFKEKGLI